MKNKPIEQIQHEGMSALIQEPRSVDTARFLRTFSPESGDYTIERWDMGNRCIDELVTDMKKIEVIIQ